MSALGHKRTFAAQQGMSALPPIATAKADIQWRIGEASPRRSLRDGMRRYKTSSRPAKQREGRSLAPTTGISVVSLKRGQSGTKRSRPPMGQSRCYWSGIALHAGVLPGYPASHGCIRLTNAFAIQLWHLTKRGTRVIIAHDDVRPVEIANPTYSA
jgi:hypothetical protein